MVVEVAFRGQTEQLRQNRDGSLRGGILPYKGLMGTGGQSRYAFQGLRVRAAPPHSRIYRVPPGMAVRCVMAERNTYYFSLFRIRMLALYIWCLE